MAVKDEDGIGHLNKVLMGSDGSPSVSDDAMELKEQQFSCASDYSPKVRKPYTITKQRERWTEEDHKKFLEALKLHGRAWRKIEEHIGTKTAAQIRSHAQKFFSKVTKESNESNVSSIEPMEIPPPRPKRKPIHPYPRKLAHPTMKVHLFVGQTGRSPSPNFSLSEAENLSPTSVLSTFASDALGSSGSFTPSPNCTLSPSSSTDGNSLSWLLFAHDSVAEKNAEKSLGTGRTSPHGSFKLFGTTVVIAESQMQDSPFSKTHALPVEIERAKGHEPNCEATTFPFIPMLYEMSYSRPGLNLASKDFGTRAFSSTFKEVSSIGISRPEKRARGFVPYKRGVAQELVSQS